MLLSLLLLALALLSLGLALLTVVRVPVWLNWRAALLAGEFGWLLGVAPLLVGGTAWARWPDDAGVAGT
ncbi:MAG TPA: hypothetical protein PLF88_09495, partial [Opitutaceae bacterium]|nr:hypothetical protein [Opitutaceae bacterium]